VDHFDPSRTWDQLEAGTFVRDDESGQTYEVGGRLEWYRWLRNAGGGEHKVVRLVDVIEHSRWRPVQAESAV
jgi:hypothetical protein